MSKITILKIGLAAGIYNLLSILFLSITAEMHIRSFGRFMMSAMQQYGAYGYNLTFSGIVCGCFWAFVLGFIQFGLIALIFNILSTRKSKNK